MKAFNASITTVLICLFTMIGLPIQAELVINQTLATFDSCPTASFSIANNGQLTSTPIQFVNESTGGLSYRWDFGDGSTSTAVNPAHVYTAPGTYTVKLTVIGDACTVEFIGTEDLIIG